MSNVRALTRIRRTRWRNDGCASKSAFNPSQMQAAHLQPSSEPASFPWSGSERRFALLVLSLNGLRFAQLNSQKVSVLRARRPSLRSKPVRLQRVIHRKSTPRFARFHSNPVRHRLRSALFPPTSSVPSGNQRPNPSVEGMAKRLRLLSTPHLKR
jgi:hypothetical protein